MSFTVSADLQMWVTFGIILLALAAYVAEKWPMVLTSLGTICATLVFFQFFQVEGVDPLRTEGYLLLVSCRDLRIQR